MLVVEASVALRACAVANGSQELGEHELLAPALMWSEALSALHEQLGEAISTSRTRRGYGRGWTGHP